MSYTQKSLENLKFKASANYKVFKKTLQQTTKVQNRQLDKIMLDLHTHEFKLINCLECANCCKTISPAIFNSDIRRMAASLKIKTSVFTDKYLLQDEEGEFVFNRTPCPFLGNDNFCEIYDFRPKACREYPHTDRNRFYQILELTARNSKICPAVYNIITKLKIVLK